MEPISKSVFRKPGNRKDRLILTVDRSAFLAFLALPIIAGLEMYYQNRYGDPDTTYIGGFWTFVYGMGWLIAFLMRREGAKKFRAWLISQGKSIEETVRFTDSGFEASITGYFQSQYSWASLSAFTIGKRHIRLNVAGVEFMFPTKHFTPDEIHKIEALADAKRGRRTSH